jgi:hypothetical protein
LETEKNNNKYKGERRREEPKPIQQGLLRDDTTTEAYSFQSPCAISLA